MNKLFILLLIVAMCVSVVFFTLLVDWYLDDDRRKQNNDDSGDNIDNLGIDSEHSGVVRHTQEEMIQVLQTMRVGACRYEREVIDEIINMITEREGEANDD